VTDENGRSVGSTTISILGHDLSTTGRPATSADLAPITAFQLNIGGDYYTLENANLAFGQLPVTAHQVVTQSFRATPTGADTAALEAAVRGRGHALRPTTKAPAAAHPQ
jgi:hypothetical protein